MIFLEATQLVPVLLDLALYSLNLRIKFFELIFPVSFALVFLLFLCLFLFLETVVMVNKVHQVHVVLLELVL